MGIGGGIILVPVLIAFFSVDATHARGASLVSVCVTSLAGSVVYLREGVTDLQKASYMQLPTVVGAITGALLGSRLDDRAIRLAFAALVLFVGWKMLFGKNTEDDARGENHQWVKAGTACFGGGVLSSLLGVGGGLVFVPVLVLLLSAEQRSASATSTYLIGLTAAASGLIYYQHGQVDVGIAIPAALGILIGAQIGAHVSGLVSGFWLRKIFGIVMWVNAYLLAEKAVRQWLG